MGDLTRDSIYLSQQHLDPVKSIHNRRNNKRCITLVGLAIYIKKYLKAKEELWKFQYFTMQKYNLQKNPLKETKILQNIITL
jgi:hypothetical protein